MAKKTKPAEPAGGVLANAKEAAKIEQYWLLAGQPRRRKPPKPELTGDTCNSPGT